MTTQNILLIGAAVLAVLLILYLLLRVFVLQRRVDHLAKKYDTFMHGKDGGSLEVILSAEIKELRDMVASSRGMLHQQELLATMQLKSIQKTGLVRYDAFEETGDRLSFSLTLLDGNNNGILLSSLSGEETARIYCKQIQNGECRESISAEEAESIRLALNTLMPDVAARAAEAAAQASDEGNQKPSDFLYGAAYGAYDEEPAPEPEQTPAANSARPDRHKIDMK